ncbi:MAG: hypothetical protein IPQ23_22035 [Cytophagaceae bacterium]|nr:hypothetical protein [Cytophagaceae bacterium]
MKNELPELGVFSWTIIVQFVLVNSFLLLWAFSNYQRSSKSNESNSNEDEYDFIIELTGYPIPKECFVNLNKEVINALFWIYSKGYVSEEDFQVIDINFYLPDGNSNWPERMRLMKENYQETRNKYQLHKKNNMVFNADNFFHTFFGINK